MTERSRAGSFTVPNCFNCDYGENEETERDDEYVPNLGERLPELLAAELGGDPEDYDADAEGKNYSMPDLDTLESISADEFYDDGETEGER